MHEHAVTRQAIHPPVHLAGAPSATSHLAFVVSKYAAVRRDSSASTKPTPPRVTSTNLTHRHASTHTATRHGGTHWLCRVTVLYQYGPPVDGSEHATHALWLGGAGCSQWLVCVWPRKSNTAAPRCCRSPSTSRAAVAETAWAGGARRRVGRRARLREARRRLAESAPAPPLHPPARGSPRAPEVRRA